MIKINNKEESKNFIVRLGLNRVPEIFLEKHETEKIKDFFNTYPAELYVLRDAEHSSGKYFYVTTAKECIELAQNYSGRVIVAVSSNAYKNKLLLGAVEIGDRAVMLCATTDTKLDHRTMYGDLEFKLNCDIFDKRLSDVPEFDYLYQYISSHGLKNYVVEFTVYDRPVGTNGERIVINEVRNY